MKKKIIDNVTYQVAKKAAELQMRKAAAYRVEAAWMVEGYEDDGTRGLTEPFGLAYT
jgi:hypothetical protein